MPLLALLNANPGGTFDTLETKSTDGFVSQLPLSLVAKGATGGAVAWIAAEDPAHPWPKLSRPDCVGWSVLSDLAIP